MIKKSATALATASDGSPLISTLVVMMFYLMFNVLEAATEKVFFGGRFDHFLDPVFILGFIAYAGYSVYACALFNSVKANKKVNS